MDEELERVIIRLYGEQCRKYLTEIDNRIVHIITAILYAGNQGDNPLCMLNRLFEAIEK